MPENMLARARNCAGNITEYRMATLVAQEEIAGMVSDAIYQALNVTGVYDRVEAEAAKLIRDESGITLPVSSAERPATYDWCVKPAAWIIQWFAADSLTSLSPETEQNWQQRYVEALRIIRNHRMQSSSQPGTSAYIGTIRGLYE